MKFYPAVIRGKTIVLEADPELAEGQHVEVVILPVPRERVPGESLLRSAGSLADDPDFDTDMAEVKRARQFISGREVPG